LTSGRERIQSAMTLQEPREIPVMCQLSIGHILLNTSVDPVEFNFTNKGYAQGLLEIRDRYDFDGILIHKPGRDERVISLTRQEVLENGVALIFPDGGTILCLYDDDPHYLRPKGFRKPSLENFKLLEMIDSVPPSMSHWWMNCGLMELNSLVDVPEFWYAPIDLVRKATQDRYSIHGEVNSPFDSIFHLLDYGDVLLGLIKHPDKIHKILARLTQISAIWARAQVRRGCDAIKLSSPWAGSSFISRAHYKEFVLPYESQIVEVVRDQGGYVYTHTCGSIGDRLDLIFESGVQGIECLDPPPLGDVALEDAVAAWGDRFFIKGNVDSVNTLLTKSSEDVLIDAKHRLKIGSRGKGFILSTACSIAPHVPPENVLALVKAARQFSN
jgi:hypothetical protein